MSKCKNCIKKDVCNRDVCHEYSVCPHYLSADVVEVIRCKDCILHEEGCPLDTHPYMTADDGYCYLGLRLCKDERL